MEYKVESSLENFPAWSGGKDTLNTLIEKGDVDLVESFLVDSFFENTPTETEINDFLWFERDAIADYLGYKDWETYEYGEKEEEEEDVDYDFERGDFAFFEELLFTDPQNLSGVYITTILKRIDDNLKLYAKVPTDDLGVERLEELADLSDQDFLDLMEKIKSVE